MSKSDIKKYLQEIPPIPENVKNALKFLDSGEIKKAAQEAEKDLVLKKQIESVVNSAYYALPKKVENITQLFTLLGIEKTRSLIYSYLVSLLEPKKWKIFNIDFLDFRAHFMQEFEENMKIEFDEKTFKEYAEVGAIIPAVVCVCDSLLGDKKSDVDIIMESSEIDYGSLIKRLTGFSLFSLAGEIAKMWELDDKKIEVIKEAECVKCTNKIPAIIHLTFFYLVSKPNFYDLNSLIEFNPDVVELIPKVYERMINDS